MAITKPAVLPAWAETATPTTDILQPSNPEIQAGWALSTTPPSRQRFNWLLNFCANAVRYFCRAGLADYDAAETYIIGDLTRGDDGKIYRSKVNANINHTPSTSGTQWGSPQVPTPAADDNTAAIANTAYVIGQISVTLPLMNGVASFGTSKKVAREDHVHASDTSKANTSGTYLSMTVGAASTAGAVPFSGITGKPTTVGGYGITDAITTTNIGSQSVAFATNAGRAFPKRSDGVSIDIIWSGLGGQPNWLVGSNDGVSFNVFNPANFNVNGANYSTTRASGTSDDTIATTAFVHSLLTNGTFTPTGAGVLNVTAVTPGQAFYFRSGNYVHAEGQVSVAANNFGAEFYLTLPIASDLQTSADLNGIATALVGVSSMTSLIVQGDPTNNRARFTGALTSGSTNDVRYSYGYLIK